jgi:hypothetical protein
MWSVEFNLEPRPSTFVGSNFFLDNRTNELKMFSFIGDPDQEEIAEFEKSN